MHRLPQLSQLGTLIQAQRKTGLTQRDTLASDLRTCSVLAGRRCTGM